MSYADALRDACRDAFDKLHEGVSRLVFTDFPDYANVGDSAIALGQWEYWNSKGITVDSVYSVPIEPRRVSRSHFPVVINGGGNFGGLYPDLSEHRYQLAETLDQSTLLIQEPQSVHFVDDQAHEEFIHRMSARENMRIGVRDQVSFDLLKHDVPNLILSPDAVHLLGPIESAPAQQPVVILARTDSESDQKASPLESRDWLNDPVRLSASAWFSWRSRQLPLIKPLFYRQPAVWRAKAQRRLSRGVAVLSVGETIITDRLHAMLIGLQMGRRVIAIDNNNRKLTSYAETWFKDQLPNLQFAESFAHARRLAG